jgi:hypothetical protein
MNTLSTAMRHLAELGKNECPLERLSPDQQAIAAEANSQITAFANRQHFSGSLSQALADTLNFYDKWDSAQLKHVPVLVDPIAMARYVEDYCDDPSLSGITDIVAQIISSPSTDEEGCTPSVDEAKELLMSMTEHSYLAKMISDAIEHTCVPSPGSVEDTATDATHMRFWVEIDALTDKAPLKPEWVMEGDKSTHYAASRGEWDWIPIPKRSVYSKSNTADVDESVQGDHIPSVTGRHSIADNASSATTTLGVPESPDALGEVA